MKQAEISFNIHQDGNWKLQIEGKEFRAAEIRVGKAYPVTASITFNQIKYHLQVNGNLSWEDNTLTLE